VFAWATFVASLLATDGKSNQLALMASLSTFLLSLAIYISNDMVDIEVDKINAPSRPLIGRSVNKTDVLTLVLLLNFGGMTIAYWLGCNAFYIAIAEIVLGITYSVKPFSLKDRFLAKTLAIGFGGILAIMFGGVANGNINEVVAYGAAIFLIFLFVTSPVNDLADYVGDQSQGRRTIPIIIGPKNTIKLAIFSAITPFASALVLLPALRLNILTLILLFLHTSFSLILLAPLLKNSLDVKLVRKQHKRMVPLHFFLQGTLAIGVLQFPF